jgi:hypothetical protein
MIVAQNTIEDQNMRTRTHAFKLNEVEHGKDTAQTREIRRTNGDLHPTLAVRQ